MSRVEQALRRAAGAPMVARTVDPVIHAVVKADQPVSLDLYPPELETNGAPSDPASVLGTDNLMPLQPLLGRDFLPSQSGAYSHKLITTGAVAPTTIEQYRRLAAALHYIQGEQGLRTLMVTSAVPQEGKTLTIVNLAMTLSECYNRRVLLIDADLRRPSIHDVLGISNRRGLCEALRSRSGAVEFVRVSSWLSVLPAGLPDGDPMAALASPRMATFLEEAATEFDWILLDAPPVALMADAALLVRLTRAVIFVIGAGSTPAPLIEKAITELGREHIIGTVLNRSEDDPVDLAPYYALAAGASSSHGTSRRPE